MRSKWHPVLLSTVCMALLSSTATAQVLFSSDFSTSTGWTTIGAANGDSVTTFGFDYNNPGDSLSPRVPVNPNDPGNTTALKIEVNKSLGARAEVSVVSTQSFSGSYRVEFDSWFNYVGEINLGGAGSTEFGGGVVGNNGSDNGYASGSQVTFTGDAGSGTDLRTYADGGGGTGADGTLTLAETTYNPLLTGLNHPNIGGELEIFLSASAPADQLTNFPSQTGVTRDGSAGFGWRHWDILVLENEGQAVWTVDGTLVVTHGTTDGNGFSTTGSAGVTYADLFASIAGDADVTFGLFDNFVVTQTSGVTADFNGNGVVDAADYTAWRDNLGLLTGATNAQGDADGDFDVDADDYTVWQNQFGSVASQSSGTAVPELSALVLMLTAMAATGRVRRS